jgi:hypothetical protein
MNEFGDKKSRRLNDFTYLVHLSELIGSNCGIDVAKLLIFHKAGSLDSSFRIGSMKDLTIGYVNIKQELETEERMQRMV